MGCPTGFLSLLLFTSVDFSTSSSCFLYRQLLSFKENEARPYRQLCKRRKHFFLCASFRKKALLRIQFLKDELSKKPLSVHKKVSTAFSLKFTLITSFWPKKNIENRANNTYLLISFSILQFSFILLVLCLSFYVPHNLPKKLFSVDILKFHVLQSPTALPNYVSSVQFTVLRGHRKMGNRKVFESLQNQSTWACVTWTEPWTPSLAETPWPSCAIDFSVSVCLHLFLCLFCLLCCNLSHYFISHPSQTQWEGYFLL